MKFLSKLLEFMGWLQIFISPVIISCIVGGFFYLANPFSLGKLICIIIILSGILLGFFYANKIAKKEGTINHMSKLIRHPELEKEIGDENNSLEENI